MTLLNPGFEVDASDWLRSNATIVTLTRDTTVKRSGAASGKVATTGAGYVSSGATSTPAAPGQVWRVVGHLSGAAGGTVAAGVVFVDSAGTTITSTASPDQSLATPDWRRLEVDATAPAGTAYVRARFYQRATAAATFWLDDADAFQPTRLAVSEHATGGVLVELAGAPGPLEVAYSSDMEQADPTTGWSTKAGATLSAAPGFDSQGLQVQGTISAGSPLYCRRSVPTTAGALYELRLTGTPYSSPLDLQLEVNGQPAGDVLYGATTPTGMAVRFTAAGSSTQIGVRATQPSWVPDSTLVAYQLDDVALDKLPTGSRDTVLTRTDANGTALVRLAAGQRPIGGALTIVDQEASTAGLVRYDVTDAAGNLTTASLARSTWQPATLLVPAMPGQRVQLEQVTGLDHRRESASVVTNDISAPMPAVAGGRLRGRVGRIVAWCSSYQRAREVEQLADLGQPLMLRQSDLPGADRYLAVTGVDTRLDELIEGGQVWAVAIDHVEVDRPAGPLLGAAGWTYAASSSRYATYAELAGAFPTYADLIVGPTA